MRIDDLLRRSAKLYPDELAIDDGHRIVTYVQLWSESQALSGGLLASGLTAGDRIAVLAKNRIEYAVAYSATSACGLVIVPLNWRLHARQLGQIIADAGVKLIIAEEEFVPVIESLSTELDGIAHRVLIGAPVHAHWVSYSEMLNSATPLAAVDPDTPVVQMYTSGTTGAPKGALLTHNNIRAMVASWLLELPLQPRTDLFLQVTPLFHVGGMLLLLSCAAAGTPMLLQPEFSPGPVARALTERRVTHTLLVPAMIRWLLKQPGINEMDFSALRMMVYGASPIPVATLCEAMRVFGCDFLQGYGLTETAGVLTVLRPEDHRFDPDAPPPPKLASAGREVLCCEVAVVDENGDPVEVGQRGEIVARGDNITPGYYQRQGDTAEALRDGWFHTGDVGTIDEEGYITIVDRVKDMILVGGENVYPREVELVLRKFDAVSDVAVIGIPHDVWGEEVIAYVVPADGEQGSDKLARELIRGCRESLARYMCPTQMLFIDTLPTNAAGKVTKNELRERHWLGRSRNV